MIPFIRLRYDIVMDFRDSLSLRSNYISLSKGYYLTCLEEIFTSEDCTNFNFVVFLSLYSYPCLWQIIHYVMLNHRKTKGSSGKNGSSMHLL